MVNRLYAAPDVATLLGVELDTLYRYARSGKLKGIKLGKLWRFTEADVEEFAQSHRYVTAPVGSAVRLLPELLRSGDRGRRPDGSLICGAKQLSYREIDLFSDRLARVLIDRGLRPGDRVQTALSTSAEFLIACFAAWKARAVLVAVDTGARLPTLLHALNDSGAKILIVDRAVAEQLEGICQSLPALHAIFVKDRTFTLTGVDNTEVESLDELLQQGSHASVALPTGASPAEVVSITYTSGSTGTPKGVMHTHESWLAAAEFTRQFLSLDAADAMVIPLPLHHGLAFRQLLAHLLANATIILATDIYHALKLLREQRPTGLLLVPAACNLILDHCASVLRDADAALRYVEIGSAAMSPERLRSLRKLLPTTAIHLPYGLTEARVGYLKQGRDGLFNRIGRVLPGLELQVRDQAGAPVRSGEVGEIVLRGRGLMKGYWGLPAVEQTLPKNEGFRTGDLAWVDDDGEVTLLGRLDDMLKVGGRKVNPFEIEMVLNRHPSVVESAVCGRPDPIGIFEQELHAFVVASGDVPPSESELRDHCAACLESYKIPSHIHFRTSLPKSPVGKVQRHVLAAEQRPNSTQ